MRNIPFTKYWSFCDHSYKCECGQKLNNNIRKLNIAIWNVMAGRIGMIKDPQGVWGNPKGFLLTRKFFIYFVLSFGYKWPSASSTMYWLGNIIGIMIRIM